VYLEIVRSGPEQPPSRLVWFAVLLAFSVLTITGVVFYLARVHAVALAELTRFEAAYAERCEGDYPVEMAAQVRRQYLRSSALRQALRGQRTALETGASCAAVAEVLRRIDFPLPPARDAVPASPPILLEPMLLTPTGP